MNEKPRSDEEKGKTDLEPARRYREKVAEHGRESDTDAEAEQARRDVEGPEGEDLRRAEQAGKQRAAEEDPEIDRVSEKLREAPRPIPR